MDMDEFKALRSEMQTRINLMYSHNFTIVTVIIAAWSLIAKAYTDCIGKADALCGYVALLPMALAFISAILMKQWNENYISMASISAYIKVRYEMPTLMASNTEKKLGWETYCSTNTFMHKSRVNFSNKTYHIVSVVSILFTFALLLHFGMFVYDKTNIGLLHPVTIGIIGGIGFILWCMVYFPNIKMDTRNTVLNQIYNNIIYIVEKENYPADKAKAYLENYVFFNFTPYGTKQHILTSKDIQTAKQTKEYYYLFNFLDKKITSQENHNEQQGNHSKNTKNDV